MYKTLSEEKKEQKKQNLINKTQKDPRYQEYKTRVENVLMSILRANYPKQTHFSEVRIKDNNKKLADLLQCKLHEIENIDDKYTKDVIQIFLRQQQSIHIGKTKQTS